MRTLLIHSDYLKYKTRSKTKLAEEISDEKRSAGVENALVAFIAVEKEDEDDPKIIVKKAVKEILDIQNKINAENIVIYPYAHLSSSLADASVATGISKGMEEELENNNESVLRVPFGWYKSFELACKGHPLSELSRTITTEPDEDEEEEEQDNEPSKLFIMENGSLYDVHDYKYKTKTLKQLVNHEEGKTSDTGKQPPHVKLMKEKGLADHERSADIGHMRWYPKGKLVRDLLADYVYNLTTERGAMPVETPIMYDLADPAIRVHAAKFGERQYRLKTKHKNLMLRFACCFGAFRILADSFLTWRNLPVGLYELSTYSFRYEKQGEVVGLKRLRGFTMPDFHSVCLNMEHAKEVFEDQVDMCAQTEKDLEVHYEVAFRATQAFYDEHENWVKKVVEQLGKPVLLEILPERKHYWEAKVDFAAIDYLGRPIENPTVQIDVESAERFGITYLDEDEQKKYPTILHCSPTGSIERVICSLLEKTSTDDKAKKPSLPLWLSPIQVRVIPVTENHQEYAETVYQQLKDSQIRVDIDDSPERVGKKIRNAGKDWVPYTIVVGDNEVENGNITVNRRSDNTKEEMDIKSLADEIHEITKGMPYRPLPIPASVYKRVNF